MKLKPNIQSQVGIISLYGVSMYLTSCEEQGILLYLILLIDDIGVKNHRVSFTQPLRNILPFHVIKSQ